jgi:hypothetical protein
MSTPEVISTVKRLVEVADLETIETYRLIAERDIFASAREDVEIDPSYTLTVDFRDAGDGFRVRLVTDIDTPLGGISCGVLGEYGIGQARLRTETSEALTEFINGVALMHLIPYARQSIADLTQRVFGAPLLMPMIQRGQISFSPSEVASVEVTPRGTEEPTSS